jgi:hypothetical protein
MLVLTGIIAVLTVVDLSLNEVTKEAARTTSAATEGRRPPGYFGLQGELVCVKPLSKQIPVINGPVPTTHPVVSLQASGDTLWLWDPAPNRGEDGTRHALRVRAEDVALIGATGSQC